MASSRGLIVLLAVGCSQDGPSAERIDAVCREYCGVLAQCEDVSPALCTPDCRERLRAASGGDAEACITHLYGFAAPCAEFVDYAASSPDCGRVLHDIAGGVASCPCDEDACDTCWCFTEQENACDPDVFAARDGCDCGCHFRDLDCGAPPGESEAESEGEACTLSACGPGTFAYSCDDADPEVQIGYCDNGDIHVATVRYDDGGEVRCEQDCDRSGHGTCEDKEGARCEW